MSTSWLSRLDRPTTYPELRTLYGEIAAAVGSSGARAADLEEAIRLIGRESVRDQAELESFEAVYADFKEKESGVVGWIRRHLPFTETRRKDKAHRSEVRDQQAELLSNLLVVARIRLLREGLLGERERPHGAPVEIWQSRLAEARASGDLREVADRALALNEGVGYAQTFLEDIRTDVEGFADAAFAGAEERALQETDLAEARAELGDRLVEVERKQALFEETKAQLRQDLHERLLSSNPAFRETGHRIEGLTALEGAADSVRAHLDGLHAALEETHGHAEALSTLESQPQPLAKDPATHAAETERYEDRQRETELEVTRAQAELDRARQSAQEARDLVHTLRAELRAASEASGMVEADPSAGFDDSTLRHAEAALAEAQRRAGEATTVHATANAAAEAAKGARAQWAADEAQAREAQSRREEQRERALTDLRSADEEMQRQVDALDDVLEPYLRHSRGLMRLSSLPRLAKSLFPEHLHGAGASADAQRPADALEDALRRSDSLRKEAAAELEAIQDELTQTRGEQVEMLRIFVREQLGERRFALLEDDELLPPGSSHQR